MIITSEPIDVNQYPWCLCYVHWPSGRISKFRKNADSGTLHLKNVDQVEFNLVMTEATVYVRREPDGLE